MYVRKIDDQVLTLHVSGKLWKRSLVMRDVETGSEWAHLLGKSMAGKLEGRQLRPLITDMVTWAAWKRAHPDTSVLNMSRTSKEYSSEFYRDPSRFVFGFVVGGQAWALPMEKMKGRTVHPFEVAGESLVATFDADGAATYLFSTRVGDESLSFEKIDEQWMRDTQTDSRWTIVGGLAQQGKLTDTQLQQRVGIMSYRKAWESFYPNSQDVPF